MILLCSTKPGPLNLSAAQYRWLADRHFGVGCGSDLSVRPAADAAPGVDFAYAIHNADGGEVEHCGNGARCFLAFVRAQGLTDQRTVTIRKP
jgi:diaminopimelate epimerase